jgi:hypothetical protein
MAIARLTHDSAGMALPKLRSAFQTDPPEADAVPSIYDDPQLQKAQALSQAFRDAIARLEKTKIALTIERIFQGRAPWKNSTSDDDLLARLQSIRADLSTSTPTVPAAPDTPSRAIQLGLDLLAGRPIPAAPDHAMQIAGIDGQIDVLKAALDEQDRIVEVISDALIWKYAVLVQPRWNELVVGMFRAAQGLAASTARFREFRAQLVANGIRGGSTVLQSPAVRSPLVLGDETDWNSEIAQWRRVLEEWNLI